MSDEALDYRSRPLLNYIPQTITESVLLTTRDRRAASWLSTGYGSAIAVDLMTPKDAEQLLLTKIPDGISSALERAELVRELDYLPLAITQAAAYISAPVTTACSVLARPSSSPSSPSCSAYSNLTPCTRKTSTLLTATRTSSSRVCSPSTGRMF